MLQTLPAPKSTEALVPAAIRSMLDTLEQHLGSSFLPWSSSNSGEELPEQWQVSHVTQAIARARAQGQSVTRFSGGSFGVCIRLPKNTGGQYFAIGTVNDGDMRLWGRLAHTVRVLIERDYELVDRSADLNSFVEMLSYGLEEQTWLRSLTQHIKLCSANHTLANVAGELLPSLLRMAAADSVVFVRHAAAWSPEYVSIWVGPQLCSDLDLTSWIEQFAEELSTTPITRSGSNIDSDLRAQGINSICAVQVGMQGVKYGWLLALRRQGPFGTVEASLLEAAAVMLATHGQNVEVLRDREALVLGIIRAIGSAVDARDPYTRGHSVRVGWYGRHLATKIGLTQAECDQVYLAGVLHDVGKIGIRDEILHKPGRLTEEEFAVMRKHPEIGAKIVSTLPQLANLLPGILHHHESFDGNGYPGRLAGVEIPLMARILAIADTYDALTSDRMYRNGMPHELAAKILTERAGTQWDPELVPHFLSIGEESLSWIAQMHRDGSVESIEDFLESGLEDILRDHATHRS